MTDTQSKNCFGRKQETYTLQKELAELVNIYKQKCDSYAGYWNCHFLLMVFIRKLLFYVFLKVLCKVEFDFFRRFMQGLWSKS